MNKKYFCLALLMVGIAGCGRKTRKIDLRHNQDAVVTEVDIPVAEDTVIKSFYDGDLNELSLAEDIDAAVAHDLNNANNDFSWVEDTSVQQDFKIIYFDFNKHHITSAQEQSVVYDIAQIKRIVDEHEKSNEPVDIKIVLKGHTDDIGAKAYNLALSENRANEVKQRLVAAGIPEKYISIVGLGKEMPVMVDGKPLTGSAQEQWLNRRVEINLINC
ncbi:hypothetical protein Noda2021_12090 [Candidatus Dependentiae bacterium Noda2021]|nr:hypothetical protein Noda2021_12090 [Candidatus Dependentiae bacterium Noda2021]